MKTKDSKPEVPIENPVSQDSSIKIRTILIITGVVSGVIIGFILRHVTEGPPKQRDVVYSKFLGDIFILVLRCMILPLIVSSLISTIGRIDLSMSKKIGVRTIFYYFSTTICAVVLGITTVVTIHPGTKESKGLMDEMQAAPNSTTIDSLMDIIRNMFPDNIVQATMYQHRTTLVPPKFEEYAEQDIPIPPIHEWKMESKLADGTNIMGLLVFSIVFGIALGKMGERGKPVLGFLQTLEKIIMHILTSLMWFAPLGICTMIASQLWAAASIRQLLTNLGWYFVTVVTGLFLHGFVLLPLFYSLVTRTLPFRFFGNMLQAVFTAFGTASSLATIPVTLECLETKNGVDPRVSRFVIPVGATMNMDGTALYEAVAVIFISQIAGVSLTLGNIIAISITVTAAPQAGVVMIVTMALSTIGISPDYIALILPIDWLFDRFRTTVNVIGDSYGAGIIYHICKKDLEIQPTTRETQGIQISQLN